MMIQKRFGVPINYEDTFYAGSRHAEAIAGRPRVIPKYRALNFFIEQQSEKPLDKKVSAYAAALTSVRSLVMSFYKSRGVQLFRVVPGSEDITIQAVAYVDAHDHLQQLQPLLDKPVTLNATNLSWGIALQRVLNQLKSGQHEIVPGTITLAGPRPPGATSNATIVAANRPAREVISKILHGQTMKPAWRLLCSPAPDKVCAFNVNTVDETPGAVDMPVY